MSEVRPFGVGSEAVSEVSRFLACEVRPLPLRTCNECQLAVERFQGARLVYYPVREPLVV